MSNNQLAISNKDICASTMNRVDALRKEGRLSLPKNYSAENAINSAQLIISEVVDRNKRPALEVCTKASIAQALLDTVLQGLNPGKKQCYYIVYGSKLVMQRSYFGEMHVARSVCPDIAGIYPAVVYSGDVFKYSISRGRVIVTEHVQTLDNRKPDSIIAAYCTIVFANGEENTTIMTIDEIHSAWRMSRQAPFAADGSVKPDSTHGKFPADMAMRTVVRKACKAIINSSDDDNLLLLDSIQRTDDAINDAETDDIIYENSGVIDVDVNEPPTVDTDTGEVLDTSAAAPY